MWQTQFVVAALTAAWPGLSCQIAPFVTEGDRTLDRPLPDIGGKGLFTAELEHALRNGAIDLAVHSLKDLPTGATPGVTTGAILGRVEVRDALVAQQEWTLATLPPGAVVGTSSVRRQAQLLAARPDLTIRPIRGNVDTRVRKVLSGEFDAAVLAAAGLERLGLAEAISEWLPLTVMLPAPGQGALAVQCRADDATTLCYLAAVDDPPTRRATQAERAFLSCLGSGCSAPVAAYAQVGADGLLHLQALVATPDGRHLRRLQGAGHDEALGIQLAEEVLAMEEGGRWQAAGHDEQ